MVNNYLWLRPVPRPCAFVACSTKFANCAFDACSTKFARIARSSPAVRNSRIARSSPAVCVRNSPAVRIRNSRIARISYCRRRTCLGTRLRKTQFYLTCAKMFEAVHIITQLWGKLQVSRVSTNKQLIRSGLMVSFQKISYFYVQAWYSQLTLLNDLQHTECNWDDQNYWLFIVKKLAWSDTGSMAPVPVGSGGPEGELKVWHSGRIERCTGLSEATCSILLCQESHNLSCKLCLV